MLPSIQQYKEKVVLLRYLYNTCRDETVQIFLSIKRSKYLEELTVFGWKSQSFKGQFSINSPIDLM